MLTQAIGQGRATIAGNERGEIPFAKCRQSGRLHA